MNTDCVDWQEHDTVTEPDTWHPSLRGGTRNKGIKETLDTRDLRISTCPSWSLGDQNIRCQQLKKINNWYWFSSLNSNRPLARSHWPLFTELQRTSRSSGVPWIPHNSESWLITHHFLFIQQVCPVVLQPTLIYCCSINKRNVQSFLQVKIF